MRWNEVDPLVFSEQPTDHRFKTALNCHVRLVWVSGLGDLHVSEHALTRHVKALRKHYVLGRDLNKRPLSSLKRRSSAF